MPHSEEGPVAETREPDEQAPEGDKVQDDPTPPEQQPSSPESPSKEPPAEPEPQEPDPLEERARRQRERDKGGENATRGGIPESMTRAGRTRKSKPKKAAAKKANGKTEAKAKPKPPAKTDEQKAAEKKKEARKELAALTAKFKDRGSDQVMVRRARHLARVLEQNPPKWAGVSESEKKKSERTPEELADLALAHEATAFATDGKVVDGKVEKGKVQFGAAVTGGQIATFREIVKGKDILKGILKGCPESKLKAYAAGKAPLAELPEETRKALKDLNATFEPRLKYWARKDAVILYHLHKERKAKGRRKAAPAPSKESAPVPA